MQKHSVEAIIRALNDAEVRYLIVGGLAVIAHGYMRFTADMDFILDLEEDNLKRAVATLESLQYRPRAPVAFSDYIDADKREQWIRDKGLTVFSLFSNAHPATEVDLFVENPLDFARAFQLAVWVDIIPGLQARFVSLQDLLALKRIAGRPQDTIDIEKLEELQRED